MSRPDRDEFQDKLTFGFIPAGTANGLHKSVVTQFDEKEGIHTAAFAVAKGRTTKLDLTELDLEYYQNEETPKKVYMFLMMAWAIISDCDINSEVIRCCGPPRFTMWGVYRVMALRHYPGEFNYVGQNCKLNHIESCNNIAEYKKAWMATNFKIMCVYNAPWIAQKFNAAPLSTIDDGANDITIMTQDQSRLQLARALIAIDNGDYFTKGGEINRGLGF